MYDVQIVMTDEKQKLLRDKVASILERKTTDWCVACGAGAKATSELLVNKPELIKELISEEAMKNAFAQVNIDQFKADANWCVACGASANSYNEVDTPVEELEITMKEINKILGI